MIDKYLYYKLSNTAALTAIVRTNISNDYTKNKAPALVYYDISETYTKYNFVRNAVKSIKIITDTKKQGDQIKEIIVDLFNTNIKEEYSGIVIHTSKALNTISFFDDTNNSWITTVDIEIIYE